MMKREKERERERERTSGNVGSLFAFINELISVYRTCVTHPM